MDQLVGIDSLSLPDSVAGECLILYVIVNMVSYHVPPHIPPFELSFANRNNVSYQLNATVFLDNNALVVKLGGKVA